MRRIAVGILVFGLACGGKSGGPVTPVVSPQSGEREKEGGGKREVVEKSPKKPEKKAPIVASKEVASPDEEHLVEETPEANPTSEMITIKLVAEASRKARVFWGRKDLGFAPLELQRPRGSGPLDLLVVAPGALPLHTRVYTDRDDKLSLRLVNEADAPSLLGYHAPQASP